MQENMYELKTEKFAIEFNKIRRYDLFEDFVSIRYEKESFFFTIVKNDVSTKSSVSQKSI